MKSSTLPSIDELTKECCSMNKDAASHAVSRILNTVIIANQPDPAIVTQAIEILTQAMIGVGTAKNANDDESTSALCILEEAIATAVWWQTCQTSVSSKPKSVNTLSSSTSLSTNVNLVDVLKAVVMAWPTTGLAKRLLECVSDTDLLQTVITGLGADISRKLRVTNTTTYYRQHKFNLLAEESEGYSKFIFLLQQQQQQQHQVITQDVGCMIASLIGTFSLDPNRCLDLVIDVLDYELSEQQHTNPGQDIPQTSGRLQFLAKCIQELQVTHKLPQLLGFKLRNRSKCDALMRCMSWLCLQKILDPDSVLPYLPERHADVLERVYTDYTQRERKRIESLGRVRLASPAPGETDSITTDKVTTIAPTDRKALEGLFVVRWAILLIRWKSFTIIQSALESYWTKLSILLPTTIGAGILDWVQERIDSWVVGSPPWTNTNTSESITLEGLLQVVQPMLYTRESGCIALRPVLFTQLCRLLTFLLKGAKVSEDVVTFLRDFLVPSLSAFESNPALSMELWYVLEQLPYRTRYKLYRAWRGVGLERSALESDKPLWLIEGEIQTGKDARYALKRLSKDTIREMSRAVAKCCHKHPLVVFTTILNQIESYDNLVQVMVDACRFVTPLSLDVLGFCILQRLSGGTGGLNRNRLKENGVNVSQWLHSLENFTGVFYKRFPFIEFQGILCYLMNRLKNGHVMELGVLRTLLKSSGGWSFADYAPAASLTMTQLVGRAGSTELQKETMNFGVVEEINLRASQEVRRVLQNDNMGVSLLILLAQVRHHIVFESTNRPKPVKLIGNLVDTCQVIMAILLDFLCNAEDGQAKEEDNNFSEIQKLAHSIPSLTELHDVYKLDIPSNWMLCRPLIRAATSGCNSEDKVDALAKFKSTDESRKVYERMLPTETWTHFSVTLFEFFFSSTLYDLCCPEDVYVSEIARLDKETERLTQKLKINQAPSTVQPGFAPEKTDAEELERIKKVSVRLAADYMKQKYHVVSMHDSMKSKINDFFVSTKISSDAAVTFFVHCIYPRCMQGPDDAMYCAHFVSHLHRNETKGFSTLHFFDTMIVTISRALYCLTEGEAACAAILLLETWKLVSHWRYDDGAFEENVDGKPGAFMIIQDEAETAVSKNEFTKLYNKWHASIGASCIGCLRSKEYMHLRNCLVVLTRMVDVYPTRPKLANKLIQALEPLQDETNSLPDIRASAQAYSMQLLKARDDGVWKEEDAATVKARHDKEEAAALARQKKAEEQMAEIERDSEKITEQIGEKESRDRSRGRTFGGHRPGDHGSSSRHDHDDNRGGIDARRHAPSTVDDRRTLGSRLTPPLRDNNVQRLAPQSDRWSRDRTGVVPQSFNDPARISTSGGGVRNDDPLPPSIQAVASRSFDGRWQRPNEQEVGRKRSRPSSPVEQGETSRDDITSASKRSRLAEEEARNSSRRRVRR